MRESFLKLNDRTVVLSGPLTQVTSAIVATLSERGSDVAMVVSDKLREAQRYAENVSDAREIHHKAQTELVRVYRIAWMVGQTRIYVTDHYAGGEIESDSQTSVSSLIGIHGV